METRLSNIYGSRPHRLRRKDLPDVAKAIQAMLRLQARASTGVSQHVRFVRIYSSTVDVVVLEEDWRLILPLIEDGTFSLIRTPASAKFGYLHPPIVYDDVTLDQFDPRLYEHVLHKLQELFPDEYPTSDL